MCTIVMHEVYTLVSLLMSFVLDMNLPVIMYRRWRQYGFRWTDLYIWYVSVCMLQSIKVVNKPFCWSPPNNTPESGNSVIKAVQIPIIRILFHVWIWKKNEDYGHNSSQLTHTIPLLPPLVLWQQENISSLVCSIWVASID